MAKRKREWMWRRLQTETSGQPQPTNYRRPDFIKNAQNRTVRNHIAHPATPAIERFFAKTERVRINGDVCIVWRGGDTFRGDSKTTTPARFYWEAMGKGELGEGDTLRRGCKTAGCVRHRKIG